MPTIGFPIRDPNFRGRGSTEKDDLLQKTKREGTNTKEEKSLLFLDPTTDTGGRKEENGELLGQ